MNCVIVSISSFVDMMLDCWRRFSYLNWEEENLEFIRGDIEVFLIFEMWEGGREKSVVCEREGEVCVDIYERGECGEWGWIV